MRFTPYNIRTGLGYDVHKLVENRKLIIGGVEINYPKGLLGHSDADVLTHAIMDALLGASSLGDIGTHFPDSDKSFKDISSIELLSKTGVLMAENQFQIINIDTVIIAQEPKLSPYTEEMKNNICKALDITPQQIGIKATTTEGLGFEGRSEGISAQALCLLYRDLKD